MPIVSAGVGDPAGVLGAGDAADLARGAVRSRAPSSDASKVATNDVSAAVITASENGWAGHVCDAVPERGHELARRGHAVGLQSTA